MTSTISLGGNPVHVAGNFPQIGQTAPSFTLIGKGLADVALSSFSGKRKVLNISQASIRRPARPRYASSTRAQASWSNTLVLCISADLPFAQSVFAALKAWRMCLIFRPCAVASSSEAYGVALSDGPLAGVAARAVIVLDENDKVKKQPVGPGDQSEPDYDAALRVLGWNEAKHFT
ncbi:MAG: thiol peroxidase [Propionivibrio sp.]|nr:thiol peroxidase [Propionivibrio sp.]